MPCMEYRILLHIFRIGFVIFIALFIYNIDLEIFPLHWTQNNKQMVFWTHLIQSQNH